MNHRNLLTGLGLAAILAALTACGTATATPDTGVPSVLSPAAEEQLYLRGLDNGDVPHTDDGQAIALGRSVCTQFDAGASLTSVGFGLLGTGLGAQQAGWLAGTAVGAFCPEHIDTITSAAEQYPPGL